MPENAHVADAMRTNWAAVVEDVHPGPMDTLEYSVSSVALGQVLFVNVPGEPVSLLGQRLAQINGRHDVVFTLGYTNGLKAYFPTDEMIDEGGYEAHDLLFVYLLPAPFRKGVEESPSGRPMRMDWRFCHQWSLHLPRCFRNMTIEPFSCCRRVVRALRHSLNCSKWRGTRRFGIIPSPI